MNEPDVGSQNRSHRLWRSKFGLGCKILYVAVCYSSLATIYLNGN